MITRGVLSLLGCAVCVKCIPTMLAEIQSKNNFVRAKTCEYLAVIMENYPEEIIERNLDGISKTLKKGLADADPQARTHSRTGLICLQKNFPDEARKVFDSLDPSTRKQLNLAPPESPTAQGGPPKSAPPRKIQSLKPTTPTKGASREIEEDMGDDDDRRGTQGRNSLQATKVRAQSAVKKAGTNLGTTLKSKDAPNTKEAKTQSAMKQNSTAVKGEAVRNSGKSVDAFKEEATKTATKVPRPVASATSTTGEMREWITKLDSPVAVF